MSAVIFLLACALLLMDANVYVLNNKLETISEILKNMSDNKEDEEEDN